MISTKVETKFETKWLLQMKPHSRTDHNNRLILGLRPANERRHYKK